MNPTATNPTRTASPTKLSQLDIVIAKYAQQHGSHVSPIVGCYQCLTGVPHAPRELRAAA